MTEARPLAVQLVDPPPVVKAVHQTEEVGKPGRDGSLLGKLRWGKLIDASMSQPPIVDR